MKAINNTNTVVVKESTLTKVQKIQIVKAHNKIAAMNFAKRTAPTQTQTQGAPMKIKSQIKSQIENAISYSDLEQIEGSLGYVSASIQKLIDAEKKKFFTAVKNDAKVAMTSVTYSIPKSQWPSTIEKRRKIEAGKAAKAEAKAKAVVDVKAEVKAVAKAKLTKAEAKVAAEAKAVAKASKTDLFCPGALIALIKAFGSISIELLDYSKESFKKYTTKTTVNGRQTTVVATQSQLKQGDNRNMRSTVPSISIKNTFLTQVGFKSSEEIKDWFKEDAESISGIEFNGQKIAIQVTSLDQPGKVNVDSRVIQLNDKLNYHQRVFALVHELDHLHYNDLKATGSSDQLKLLKSIEECKSQPNHPAFLDEEHGEEELWVRHRDYLRADEAFKDFFEWYGTKSEVSTTSQKENVKVKIKTSVNTKVVKQTVLDDLLNGSAANSLKEEIVFLNDKNTVSILADLATTWSLPLDSTAKAMGLENSKFVKISWTDNSLSQRQRIVSNLNAAGLFMISETIATDRKSASKFFEYCWKIFPSLTGIVNYAKALTTTPQKINIKAPRCFLFDEESVLGWTGNDGAGLKTAGDSATITQFRVANFAGIFGKGILTDSKLILENRKVLSVDEINLSDKGKKDFQSWLLNPNSDSVVIEGNEYVKGCLISKSNLKGIDKLIPDSDIATEVPVDFWSTMLAKNNPESGKLLMPNQLSYMVDLSKASKEAVIQKILKKAKKGLQKFNLRRTEKLTKQVISLGNTKFKTNYVQMADMNAVDDSEKRQEIIIKNSVNFVPDLSFKEDELFQYVHMLRTPIQDPNAIIDVPAYNPKLVFEILSSDYEKCQDFCTSEQYNLIRKVVPELLFKNVIAKNVKNGIIWLDSKVQAILVGDNDGDMNAWLPRGNQIVDEIFQGVKRYQRQNLIIKESLKIFVLDNEEFKNALDPKAQHRLVVPNGGQLNVGSISNLVMALRSQVGFEFMADVVDLFAFSANNIQQGSIDRQKYKYVIPSLAYSHLYKGAIKINLDGQDRNLVIPGVSFIAKGHDEFLKFDDSKQWTTETLKAWFKESFKDYQDHGEEYIHDLKGELVNIYDPEGYSEFGCRLYVKKLILSIKLMKKNKSKQDLQTLINTINNLPQTLAVIEEMDAYEDFGLTKAEIEEASYHIEWKNDINHSSCPENLKDIRDGVLAQLDLNDIYDQIQKESPDLVKTEYFDSTNDENVTNFIRTLMDLKKLADEFFRDELANIGRSQSKQQEQTSLGSWVKAADQLGLSWLVNILANNRLDTNERETRLMNTDLVSRFVGGWVVGAYKDNPTKETESIMIEVIDAVSSFLEIIEEASENNNTSFFSNAVLVEPAIKVVELIDEAKDFDGLKSAMKTFKVAVTREIINFIRNNCYPEDFNISDENIVLSHHWSRMDQNLNLAYRLDKAFDLYLSYGFSFDQIKKSLPKLILKEVGYGKKKKFVVPTKVSFLLNDSWWGNLVKNLLNGCMLVNLYYPTTINLNGSYQGDFEPQAKKTWLTWTDRKIVHNFTELAPLGLSEVISKTQVINLGLENEKFQTQENEAVIEVLDANGFKMRSVKRIVKEILNQSVFVSGERFVGDTAFDEIIGYPVALLLRRRNSGKNYNYGSSFRKAMSILSDTEIQRNLDANTYTELFDQMFPAKLKEFVDRQFGITLTGFNSLADQKEYDEYIARRDELKKQSAGVSTIYRKQQQNLNYKNFSEKRKANGSSWKKMKNHLTILEHLSEQEIRHYMIHEKFTQDIEYFGQSIDAIVYKIKKADKYSIKSICRATLLLLGMDCMIDVYLNVLKNTTPTNQDQENMLRNCRRSLFTSIKHSHFKNILTNHLDENKDISFYSGDLTGVNVYAKAFPEFQFETDVEMHVDVEDEYEQADDFDDDLED